MTLKTGVMMLKIQVCHQFYNYILKFIQIENIFIFHNLTIFLSNKCSLGEHRKLTYSKFVKGSLELNGVVPLL